MFRKTKLHYVLFWIWWALFWVFGIGLSLGMGAYIARWILVVMGILMIIIWILIILTGDDGGIPSLK
jgi:ABC-type multidrug transport system permease subunit